MYVLVQGSVNESLLGYAQWASCGMFSWITVCRVLVEVSVGEEPCVLRLVKITGVCRAQRSRVACSMPFGSEECYRDCR